MKEFAGINLAAIDSNDLDYLNLLKHRLYSQYKLHVSDHLDSKYSADAVILHIYNCIQTNLSIPVNSDDCVAGLIRNLPKDDYINMIDDPGIIAKLKTALQYQGISDNNLQMVSYSDRIKAVIQIKDGLTINKSWIFTAELISRCNSNLNLDIARYILLRISTLDQAIMDDQAKMAYTIGLQIAFYTDICSYVIQKINPYKEKLDVHRLDNYEQKMLEICYICHENIEAGLNKLISLPDDLFADKSVLRPRSILSNFGRILNLRTNVPDESQVAHSSIRHQL